MAAQRQHYGIRIKKLKRDKLGKVYIPRTLTSKLLILIHIALHHTSKSQDEDYLFKHFHFLCGKNQVLSLLKTLRRICLHCTRQPSLLPRSLGLTLLAEKCREVLVSDYLYVNTHGYLVTCYC